MINLPVSSHFRPRVFMLAVAACSVPVVFESGGCHTSRPPAATGPTSQTAALMSDAPLEKVREQSAASIKTYTDPSLPADTRAAALASPDAVYGVEPAQLKRILGVVSNKKEPLEVRLAGINVLSSCDAEDAAILTKIVRDKEEPPELKSVVLDKLIVASEFSAERLELADLRPAFEAARRDTSPVVAEKATRYLVAKHDEAAIRDVAGYVANPASAPFPVASAIQILPQEKATPEVLRPYLASNDATVLVAAVEKAGRLNTLHNELTRLLKDGKQSPVVQLRAAQVLSANQENPAGVLLQAMSNPDVDDRVKQFCVRSFGQKVMTGKITGGYDPSQVDQLFQDIVKDPKTSNAVKNAVRDAREQLRDASLSPREERGAIERDPSVITSERNGEDRPAAADRAPATGRGGSATAGSDTDGPKERPPAIDKAYQPRGGSGNTGVQGARE